jgi:hypothetical protein
VEISWPVKLISDTLLPLAVVTAVGNLIDKVVVAGFGNMTNEEAAGARLANALPVAL